MNRLLLLGLLAGICLQGGDAFASVNENNLQAEGRSQLQSLVETFASEYTTCSIHFMEEASGDRSAKFYRAVMSNQASSFLTSHVLSIKGDANNDEVFNLSKEIVFINGEKRTLEHETKMVTVSSWPSEIPPGVSNEYGSDVIMYATQIAPIIARVQKIQEFQAERTPSAPHLLTVIADIPGSRDPANTATLELVFDTSKSALAEYRVSTYTGKQSEYYTGIWRFSDWTETAQGLRPTKLESEMKYFAEKPKTTDAPTTQHSLRKFTVYHIGYDEDSNVIPATWHIPDDYGRADSAS